MTRIQKEIEIGYMEEQQDNRGPRVLNGKRNYTLMGNDGRAEDGGKNSKWPEDKLCCERLSLLKYAP